MQVVDGISQYLPNLTVGLIATLTTVACIIAADTGAYFVGKNLGRTKLTDISPKKTVEGAVGGLASAVAVAVLFWKLFSWPGSMLAAAGYAVSQLCLLVDCRSSVVGVVHNAALPQYSSKQGTHSPAAHLYYYSPNVCHCQC